MGLGQQELGRPMEPLKDVWSKAIPDTQRALDDRLVNGAEYRPQGLKFVYFSL